VLRLASLLWRIRRATAIETDLLQIQAEVLDDRPNTLEVANATDQNPGSIVHPDFGNARQSGIQKCAGSRHHDDEAQGDEESELVDMLADKSVTNLRNLTCCFLRLMKLDSSAVERLGRYQVALWRQIVQTMLILRTAQYR